MITCVRFTFFRFHLGKFKNVLRFSCRVCVLSCYKLVFHRQGQYYFKAVRNKLPRNHPPQKIELLIEQEVVEVGVLRTAEHRRYFPFRKRYLPSIMVDAILKFSVPQVYLNDRH